MPARPRREASDAIMVHTLPGPADRQADGEQREPEPHRSSVRYYRAPGRGRPKWSVHLVAGVTEADVDELVRLALRAGDRLDGGGEDVE
jgi:hypothetical protein